MSDKENQEQQHSQQPLGYFLPIQSTDMDNGINLLELWKVIWQGRKVIFVSTFIAAVLSIIISLLLPNYYKAEVLLVPVTSDDKSNGLSSALGSLGGLASLAGISVGSGTNSEESLSVLTSKKFIGEFIKDIGLMPILFADDWDEEKKRWIEDDLENQPSFWDAYRKLIDDRILTTSVDSNTGLVTVTVEWKDPVLAANWVNVLVVRLNNYLRAQAIDRSTRNLKYLNEELLKSSIGDFHKTLYQLIADEQKSAMLANTQKDFAFRVIDQAIVPDKKSKPKRALIVILSILLVGIISVFFILIKESILVRKKL